jgi:hypothetical protein
MQADTAPTNILATTLPEAAAQISTSLALASLQSLAVDLRAIRDMLDISTEDPTTDTRGPESLAFFVRSSIEGVLVDYLEPAMRMLAKATTATLESLIQEWREQQELPPTGKLSS